MIEKLYGHGTVDISLGGGKKYEVLVWYTHVRNTIHEKNGIITILFCCYNLRAIVGNFGTCDIILKTTVDQNLAFDVYEDNLTDHLNLI